jgi:hypothetical protein
MSYKIKYTLLMGFDPFKHPIIVKKEDLYDEMDSINSWIEKNILPSSIWWIDYQILNEEVILEEKRNINLNNDLRSR